MIVMKVKEITSQNRRDFTAIYQCEHCKFEKKGYGYDDANFHQNVIPKMTCPNCDHISGDSYVPHAARYPEGMTV
jgi:predicted RNA-binding Zn-ribbon protein involved in translation (DUF1610 family)